MKHYITSIEPTILVGRRLTMTYEQNQTGALWQSFMPHRHQIPNRIGEQYYSLQLYPPHFFDSFDATASFEKWAAVAVSVVTELPPNIETMLLPGGQYAVFLYKGSVAGAAAAFRYIFETWLPTSDYLLADRPHFELLPPGYKPQSHLSEETIWIPITERL